MVEVGVVECEAEFVSSNDECGGAAAAAFGSVSVSVGWGRLAKSAPDFCSRGNEWRNANVCQEPAESK